MTKAEKLRAAQWRDGRAYFFAAIGPAAALGVRGLVEHHPLFADMPHPFAIALCEHAELGRGLLVSPACWFGPAARARRSEWAVGPQQMLRRYGQIPTSLLFPSWPKALDYRPERTGIERFHGWERIRPNIYRGILK